MLLQKFGIEIRNIGNTQNLYKDVDLLLGKLGVPTQGISASIQAQTVAHSLQNMFKSSYFSVSTINDCAKLVGLIIQSERLDIYNSIHCVHWSDMLPEYRQVIIALILDDFRSILTI